MHKVNRAAFYRLDATSQLLKLYVRLVALELTLKDDNAANYGHAHDVVKMVQDRNDAALSAKAIALDATLKKLWCTGKGGAQVPVSPKKYPDLRYLRHETDFPGTTTETDLTDANTALEELFEELKRHKVLPC